MNYANYDTQEAIKKIYNRLNELNNNQTLKGNNGHGRYEYHIWHGMRVIRTLGLYTTYKICVDYKDEKYVKIYNKFIISLLHDSLCQQ